MAPDLVESKVTDHGVVVPFGKPKEEPSKKVCAVPEQQLYFLTKNHKSHPEHQNALCLAVKILPPGLQGSLLYNEYIVYNVDQIRMRYVLHVSFNFKRC
jgi:poly [ADP-ribose] polymerase 2/3/4